MKASISVACFFEDVAQERFLRALIERAARMAGMPINLRVRNATHGSRVWRELEDYLRDLRQGIEPVPDVLVITIDGDCQQAAQVKKQVLDRVRRYSFPEQNIVCAVPDPHIERWYLEDQQALSQVIPGARAEKLGYKCERDRYKKALREAIRTSGVEPLLGGAEYGEEIAAQLDPTRMDRSFRNFWQGLLRILKGRIGRGLNGPFISSER